MTELAIAAPFQVEQNTEPYPGRIVYGSEKIIAALQPFIGEALLTAENCLVLPLVRPGALPSATSGEAYATQIIDMLDENDHNVPVLAELGASYLGPYRHDVETRIVRGKVVTPSRKFMLDEKDIVNDGLKRWATLINSLEPAIMLNVRGIERETALTVSSALHAFRGKPVELSVPKVISAPTTRIA